VQLQFLAQMGKLKELAKKPALGAMLFT